MEIRIRNRKLELVFLMEKKQCPVCGRDLTGELLLLERDDSQSEWRIIHRYDHCAKCSLVFDKETGKSITLKESIDKFLNYSAKRYRK